MKSRVINWVVITLISAGLTSCLTDKHDETIYMGAWRLDKHYIDGDDQTALYTYQYGEHVIYLQPNYTFHERFIHGDVPQNIYGSWSFHHGKEEFSLRDDFNGDRKFDLKYYLIMQYKAGDKEWIFKKI